VIERILQFSVAQRVLVVLVVVAIAAFGIRSLRQLPIDAVPDITNNQVRINTEAPALSPFEIEKNVTLPIEVRHLLLELVRVAPEIGHARFEVGALATDAVELLALGADPRLRRLRAQRSRVRDAQQTECRDPHTDAAPRGAQMRRRCLPTDTALPSSPISAPNNRPSSATRGVKKIVSMT